MKLNPYHPDWYRWVLGCACYTAKRYEEAVVLFKRMAHGEPPNVASGELRAVW